MAKIFGVNTKISGKVGQFIYRQTKNGTVVSEAPAKPSTPLRTRRQMNIRTQWANLGAVYKLFHGMLRKGFENLPAGISVYNAFIQANLGNVKVFITRQTRLNGGAILAPYQITCGSLPSIPITLNSSRILVSGIRLGTLTIDQNTTIADFSQAVLAHNPQFEEGDQITCFVGHQSIDSVTRTPRATINGYKVVLDSADETILWNVVDRFGFSSVDQSLGTQSTLRDGAIAWVHSRENEVTNLLLVSTQMLYVENSSLASYQSVNAFTESAKSYGGINSDPVYLQPDVDTNASIVTP